MNATIPRTPGRPRSEESRSALLDAAYWQVLDRGYATATAEAIAKAAGAGKQTLYRWWPSKGRLVLEAFASKIRIRIDRPRESALRAGDLEKFLIADIAAVNSIADALRGLVSDSVADPDLAKALRMEMFKPREAALLEVLANAALDERFRLVLAEAIEGAIFRRVMLGEVLDDLCARKLASIARLS